MARGKRPVSFRTRKLSLSAPMVLPWRRGGRVGRRRTTIPNGGQSYVLWPPFAFSCLDSAASDLPFPGRRRIQFQRGPEVMTSPRRGSDGPRDNRGSGAGRNSGGSGRSGAPRGGSGGRSGGAPSSRGARAGGGFRAGYPPPPPPGGRDGAGGARRPRSSSPGEK